MTMIRCTSCEHLNPPGTERCQSCGAWLAQQEKAPAPTSDLEERLRQLVEQGQKIEAIRIYREAVNASLAHAKDYIDALEKGIPVEALEHDFEQNLIALLEQHKKIEAIKIYRQRTGVGLKQAKDAVEALARKHNLPGQTSGCLALVAVAVVIWLLR